jgi:hypothetical protein
LFLASRPPSSLGLEQPGNAADAPTPEPKKASDVAVLDAVPAIVAACELSVPSITLADAEVGRIEVEIGPTIEEEPEVRDDAPDILIGEPIEMPLPPRTILPVAQLLTEIKVTSTPQQQPALEDQGAAGTSSGGILVVPPKWQYAVPTELIEAFSGHLHRLV